MTRVSKPALGAAVFALAAACVGCSDRIAGPAAAAGSSEPRTGGTMRFASLGDIRTLDAAASSDALSGIVVQMIIAGLVDFDERGNVVDDLARSHEVAPDGLSITFFVREGVRFHDGNELTAADVKRSIERALHPDTPNGFSSFFDRIVGFSEFQNKKADHLAGVEIGGRYVVVVRLKSRDAMLLPLFALHALRPVCASAGSRYSDAWHACGAGPFRLESGGWERGRSVTLVKHQGFFRPGLPRLDSVTFNYGVQPVTQRFKFEAGELDVLRDLNQADIARFSSDPRWKPFGAFEPERAIFGEAMNTEIPPFDNVEVRRAVSAAINREEYRLIRPGAVVPTGKAIPHGLPGHSENVEGQKFDLAAALEHMKNAGFAYDPVTKKGGYPKAIPYLAYKPGFSEASAQVLQQQLARIGLRLDIRVVSFATYLTLSQRRGRIAMSPQGWNLDYPDALDFYEALFSSRIIADENCSNAAFYKNPELDAIIATAREELDATARQKLYDRAQAIVRDDAPWAMTHGYTWYVVHQPYVKELPVHPTWVFETRSAWLDRAKSGLARRAGVFGEVLGLDRSPRARPRLAP